MSDFARGPRSEPRRDLAEAAKGRADGALQSGARIGPYEVVSLIGAGGMGEVYRARDTKLGRDVAIKILPDLFATDPDRLMRFMREARTLAALNHPHIAQIHGIEESAASDAAPATTRALVMELVEGEDLAARIARGPLPVDEAIAIATQVADALDAAHERGIIHRDLKPANIKLRADGTVKVLDFGLAKAIEGEDESGSDVVGASRATITSPAMTMRGMIMGTAMYMSPEQAKAKPVDKRADIWSFGCVLYEMLTGTRAFDGEDVTETLAAVVRADPNWSAMPASVSLRLRRVVRRCLVKDPRQRARDIGDVKLQLLEAQHERDESGVAPVSSDAQQRRGKVMTFAAGAVTMAIAIAAIIAIVWPRVSRAPQRVAFRGVLDLTVDAPVASVPGQVAVLSRDGRVLVVAATPRPGQPRQLFVRPLDQLQNTVLPGTEAARHPFFSPNGEWVGFFAEGKLKKAPIGGGATVTLADAPDDRGGTWGEDDVIVFAPTARSGFLRISASGGAATAETTLNADETAHRWPEIISGGKALIYTSVSNGVERVVAQQRNGGAPRIVHQPAYFGRYLASGHIAYLQESTLFAARFDTASLAMTSSAVPVLQDVMNTAGPSGAQIAFADTGGAVYLAGGRLSGAQLVWIDASGGTVPFREQRAQYNDPRISPDGRRVAVAVATQHRDLWIYDDRGTMTRLTSDPTNEVDPVWTRDGEHVTYAVQAANEPAAIYWKRADGVGAATLLLRGDKPLLPFSWHPNGKTLAVLENAATNNTADLYTVDFTFAADGTPKAGPKAPLVVTPFVESEPEFSPDGNWIAYQSDETGPPTQIYISPYGRSGRRVVVSTEGGMFPTWGRDGQTLFYRAPDQRIMAVTYTTKNGAFEVSAPKPWTSATLTDMGGRTVRNFDVHPDGRRILGVKNPEEEGARRTSITYVSNFLDDVRRLTASAR